MAVVDFKQFGGKYNESASVQKVLEYLGVIAPHTGRPFSEEMLLGIGGGMGITYFAFEFSDTANCYIGTEYHTYTQEPLFMPKICQRLALKETVKETAGSRTAENSLKSALEAGHPVIVWLDLASLAYQAMPPELIKYFYHRAVVYGFDEAENKVYISDKAAVPFTVTPEELAASRIAITSQKNRMMTVEVPKGVGDLKTAVLAGINDFWRGMLEPSINNFGLPALLKWAELITNPKDKKGWPKLFPPGEKLYAALRGVFFWLEIYNTPGGGMRDMYAGFLEEASQVLGQPALKEIAQQYRECARQWTALANAALPDSEAPFKEAKELMRQKKTLLETQGEAAIPEMRQIEIRLKEIRGEMREAFPLNPVQSQELLASLRTQILALHDAEQKAIAPLRSLTS